MGRMHKAGLLEAWSYLLTTPEFQMTACDVLRQLASRTQSKVGFRDGRLARPIQAPHIQLAGSKPAVRPQQTVNRVWLQGRLSRQPGAMPYPC